MLEVATKASWALLILIHASPAMVLFAPTLVRRLYGVDESGGAGVLLVHRGALFLAVIAACAYAMVAPEARRVASVVVAISVIGFLLVYARAGAPAGPLRKIALVDLVALAPLAMVAFEAWRRPAP
jgi:hypothetical protein